MKTYCPTEKLPVLKIVLKCHIPPQNQALRDEGDPLLFLGKQGCFCNQIGFQGPDANNGVEWFTISFGNFLGSWVGSYESLHTLCTRRYRSPWTIIWKSYFTFLGKECSPPHGIRLSGSKSRNSPWWAVYLGVGCAPAESANAVWSLSQHTWSGTRPQTENVPLAMAQDLHSGDLKENIELPLNSFIVD